MFQPDSIAAQDRAVTFLSDGRVQRTAPAIYTEGSELEATVKARIDLVAANRVTPAPCPGSDGAALDGLCGR